MSLFGSSPDDSTSTKNPASQSKSLFDNNTKSEGHSSLFDDGEAQNASPWDMPTPKKGKHGEAVKNLLSGSDLPESYIDTYDIILHSGFEAPAGKLSSEGVRKVLENSRISPDEQSRIVRLITAGIDPKAGYGRAEFNVLLALIGLSQQGEDSTLDSVDERRYSK